MGVSINETLKYAMQILDQLAGRPDTEVFITQTEEWIVDAFQKRIPVLICGNGGSAADAMHFAEEFTGRFRKDRPALPAIALADPTHITCVANDYGFEHIFARGVEAYGQPGGVLLALSTSGNSLNVIRAVEKCQELGMKTVCLLGKDGGRLKGMADVEIIVPGETTDRIQELHMILLHFIIERVERTMFPENYEV